MCWHLPDCKKRYFHRVFLEVIMLSNAGTHGKEKIVKRRQAFLTHNA